MQKVFSHKFLTLFVVFLAIFSFSFVASASTVIFSDGFESDFLNWTGNDPKWDTSGGNIHGGAKRGEVKGNTEPGDDVLLKHISTAGYGGVVVEFWYRIKESLEDEDHVYVEWAVDGSNWNILNDFTAITKSDTWAFASFSLPVEADDKSNFAIRFRAHLGAITSDIFYLDDVVVTGNSGTSTPLPTVESTPTPSSSPPSPSPSVTLMPTPSTDSTGSPQASPSAMRASSEPQPNSLVPNSSGSSATPMPPSASSGQATPMPNIASTSTPTLVIINTQTPIIIASPKPIKQNQEPSSNLTLTPLEDLTVASQSSDNLSASLSNFFNASKTFWLIGIMIVAVVVSLAKLKKD